MEPVHVERLGIGGHMSDRTGSPTRPVTASYLQPALTARPSLERPQSAAIVEQRSAVSSQGQWGTVVPRRIHQPVDSVHSVIKAEMPRAPSESSPQQVWTPITQASAHSQNIGSKSYSSGTIVPRVSSQLSPTVQPWSRVFSPVAQVQFQIPGQHQSHPAGLNQNMAPPQPLAIPSRTSRFAYQANSRLPRTMSRETLTEPPPRQLESRRSPIGASILGRLLPSKTEHQPIVITSNVLKSNYSSDSLNLPRSNSVAAFNNQHQQDPVFVRSSSMAVVKGSYLGFENEATNQTEVQRATMATKNSMLVSTGGGYLHQPAGINLSAVQ